MNKKITLIAGLLVLLGIPHLTAAQNYEYIPSSEFFSQFATPRTAASIAARQQAESEARRNAAQAEPEQETLYASAGEEDAIESKDSGSSYQFTISPTTLAALERIEQQKAENELRSQALQLLGGSFSLHAGAPLDPTGKGDTGKGDTGKGGTPNFLPTSSTSLSGTGFQTPVIVSLLALVSVLSLFVLRRKQTIIEA